MIKIKTVKHGYKTSLNKRNSNSSVILGPHVRPIYITYLCALEFIQDVSPVFFAAVLLLFSAYGLCDTPAVTLAIEGNFLCRGSIATGAYLTFGKENLMLQNYTFLKVIAIIIGLISKYFSKLV